jgi:hypothetical protein
MGAASRTEDARLPWAGFAQLRAGRIHVWCPSCHRRLSNMERQAEDPPTAELVHCWCDKCSAGCKDTPMYYYDGNGDRVFACVECGCSVGSPGLCGECSCEDDCAIW